MTFVCLGIAVLLTLVLTFVSYVQLLYLESLRLIRREVPSLEFFRETLVGKIGLDPEEGSLAFSLIKHVSLFSVGLFYLCALVRPNVPHWQSVLEALAISLLAMLVSTYLVPTLVYRRSRGTWLLKAVPLIRLLAVCAWPIAAIIRFYQSVLDAGKNPAGTHDLRRGTKRWNSSRLFSANVNRTMRAMPVSW